MPFITQANLSRITDQVPDDVQAQGELYKTPIYFFNKKEQEKLQKIKHVLQLGGESILKVYVQVKNEDTGNWVFEGGKPAYHKTNTCPALNSEGCNSNCRNIVVT